MGLWITKDLTWEKNTSEICKKAYTRMRMLTKLKYVGTKTKDLIEIYSMFIRSTAEYCSTVFHSNLTERLSNKIESIQKTGLKIILGQNYISYEDALEKCGLQALSARREKRCLQFGLKSLPHPITSSLFPLNPTSDTHNVRRREKIKVNSARTEQYRRSAIPYIQRKLNTHFENLKKLSKARTKGDMSKKRGPQFSNLTLFT